MKGFINNEWDRDNLEFLLNTKGDEFKAWFEQSDEDDKVYAQELMDAYARELKLKAEELRVECELSVSQEYNEAKQVIDKFLK